MTSWSVLSQSDSLPAESAESSQAFEHIVPAAAAAGLHETKAANRSRFEEKQEILNTYMFFLYLLNELSLPYWHVL